MLRWSWGIGFSLLLFDKRRGESEQRVWVIFGTGGCKKVEESSFLVPSVGQCLTSPSVSGERLGWV